MKTPHGPDTESDGTLVSEKREAKLYGGQAILEGVMMKGATKAVASVRNPDGQIVSKTIAEWPDKINKGFRQYPFIRGIYMLGTSLSLGMTALKYSASIAMPDEEGKPSNPLVENLMFGVSIVLAVGLFLVLPTKLPVWLGFKNMGFSPLWLNLIEGVIKIVVFIGYIMAISLMKDIRRVFQYHGAEHKTVNAYEAKVPLTVENVQKFPTAHYRCGTSFLFIVVIVHILLVVPFGFADSLLVRTAIRLGTLLPVASISYEILRYSAAHKSSFLCKLLFAPGLLFQKMTALEPDDSMVEVAIDAFSKVIPEDDPTLISA
jgi:uncharacterized protein YqhQ